MTDLQIQYKVRGIGDESGPDMATHRPCWYLLRDRLRTEIIGNKLRADGADNSPGPPNAKEILGRDEDNTRYTCQWREEHRSG